MGEKNRHFSREFKQNAVGLVIEKGMSVGLAPFCNGHLNMA